jgi:hypothetical protein
MSRCTGKDRRRLLFASCHSHIDPSSGAAVSVRVLLQQLAASGWQIRTFCGPLLDVCRDEDVRQILADARLAVRQDISRYGDGAAGRLLTFQDNGVDSCVFLPSDAAQVADTRLWGHVYLEHYVRVLNDFRAGGRADIWRRSRGGKSAAAGATVGNCHGFLAAEPRLSRRLVSLMSSIA